MSKFFGPWTKFYHLNWLTNIEVNQMTMEERAGYFQLLALQMHNRLIPLFTPENWEFYRKYVGSSTDTYETVSAKYVTPRVLAHFSPAPDAPTKMRHSGLDEVISEGRSKIKDALKKYGKLASDSSASSEEPAQMFDFTPLIKMYPQRVRNEGVAGGLRLMQNTITTQSEYDALAVAICNYKKMAAAAGRGAIHILALSNFMKQWTDHLPEGYVRSEEKAAAAVAPKVELSEEETKKARLSTWRRTSVGKKNAPWQGCPEEIPTDVFMDFWNKETWEMWLSGGEPQKEYADKYAMWVAKVREAYVKATGKELTDDIWKI